MENIIGIATREGPAYRRRVRGIARYVDKALAAELDREAASG
ncbi:MAG: hypothetical protein ACRDUT_00100 [Mycobacterium sp.]